MKDNVNMVKRNSIDVALTQAIIVPILFARGIDMDRTFLSIWSIYRSFISIIRVFYIILRYIFI